VTQLLFLDTRGIKKYVDERSYLYELRASSVNLASAMEETVKDLESQSQLKRIFVGGGNAPLSSDDTNVDLKTFDRAKIKAKFIEFLELPSDSIHPDLSIEFVDEKDRGNMLENLAIKKREIHSQLRRKLPNSKDACTSCQERKGTVVVKYEEVDEDRRLCKPCASLREKGQRQYRNFLLSLIKEYNIELGIEKILKMQLEFIAGSNLEESDIEIHKARMAIVLVDGNLFGEFFSSIKDISKLAEVSELIDSEMKTIFDSEVKEITKTNQLDAVRLKLGKIYIGGDDMKLILPGRVCIPFAYRLINAFSEWANKKLSENLALSVGISITKPKVKLNTAFDMGKYLLNQAKGIHKREYKGSIDFHLGLNTIIPTTLHAYRRREDVNNNYNAGVNVGDTFWNIMTKILPELENYDILDIKYIDAIKSNYLQPWRTINQRIVDNNGDIKEAILFCAYMFNRAENSKRKTAKGYRSAMKLLTLSEYNYLLRAIELVKVRCEL